MTTAFNRIHLIVMDSVGIGEGPDATDLKMRVLIHSNTL